MIRNTGNRNGEWLHNFIYVTWWGVPPAIKELKGFKKVALNAGETKEISLFSPEDLAFYGIDMKKRTEPGKFKLWVSQNSMDISNEAEFSVE